MMYISPAQCRAARSLLGWTQSELEAASKVARKTISDFEGEVTTPRGKTLEILKTALEAAGVEFIPANGGGPGVRLKE